MRYNFKNIRNDDKRSLDILLKELRQGLYRNHTFNDQFKSFFVDVTIDANEEVSIRNELNNIPQEWDVVDAKNAPAGSLMRGATKWTKDYVYIKNTYPENAGTFRIRFFEGEPQTRSIGETTDFTPIGSGVDHGALSGLGDDDHLQYLNETRHDGLPSDNPHSVTFTQAVTADAGTNITAAEAETLTNGSDADALHTHPGVLDESECLLLMLMGA